MSRIFNILRVAYFRARGYYVLTLNGHKFKLDPYHIEFWRKVESGSWEPYTYKIMDTFLNSKSIYCDIGAWIGPTIIYAAKKCKQVICFEPDPVAYQYLCWNIGLNRLRNVASFNIALANSTEIRRISSFGKLGDAMTSLLNPDKEKGGVDVLTLTWDVYLQLSKLEKVDFIKIDIEGGEFELIPSLKNYLSVSKPIVYLSLHLPFLDVGMRMENLQKIIDVMSIYKKCLDQNMRLIDIHELEIGDTLNQFTSYVFMD